ncbi:MAG: hypothetical protein IKF75_04170, partial [Lachnospiraceae bacterium]|nr:hypothetical protein [Lachnospiraceae bacterium]
FLEKQTIEKLLNKYCKFMPVSVIFGKKQEWKDRKTYRYFKCPGCGQEVRVPKGKGRIRITCPKCHQSFEKTV